MMDFEKEQLIQFRDLKLSKKELMNILPKHLDMDEPILINNSHLIHLL